MQHTFKPHVPSLWRALAVLCLLTNLVPAMASELANKLRDGHVLLMRHATAPGVSDPAGFKLDDCRTQRNLSAQGHQEAARAGAWLKAQGVTQADVLSSAWCRCQDTARGLGYGEHQVVDALASFFENPSQALATTAALQALVAQRRSKPKALILVTHNVNIQAYAGAHVGSGDMVLARVDARGRVLGFEHLHVPAFEPAAPDRLQLR